MVLVETDKNNYRIVQLFRENRSKCFRTFKNQRKENEISYKEFASF